MKMITIFFLAFFVSAAFVKIRTGTPSSTSAASGIAAYKKRFAIGCMPAAGDWNKQDSAAVIPLLNGWGNYSMPVTTANDSCRIYFEQGINMYYGFHVIEALASFDKATYFDSSFAMGYWGIALSLGPNINDEGYNASPEALTAMHRAKQFSNSCTPVEKALIDAMQARYSPDTNSNREQLNQAYSDAMQQVHANFPGSADAATLYVDALMLQHPWDLYTKSYQPKSWTPEIVNNLETILKQFPDHPGASHYYIHAVEASAHPEKALTAANNLPLLMPGVAHIVHMPSHIYIRSGYYKAGEEVNAKAVKAYYDYLGRFAPAANNAALYLIHNLHMQATCSNMDGRYKQAFKISVDCRNSLDTSWQSLPAYSGIFMQYLFMTPYLTQIRFGRWDDILATQENPTAYVYANLLWHYGQGLARARKHDFEKARQHLASVENSLANKQLHAPAPPFANAGIAGASVAQKILAGVIAEEENRVEDAINFLTKAVALEDDMIYNEPRDWVHPARQYLGNALLKAKKYSDAEKTFQEDLNINPNNGWSLTGLATALSKQGQRQASKATGAKAKKAFSKADEPIINPVF